MCPLGPIPRSTSTRPAAPAKRAFAYERINGPTSIIEVREALHELATDIALKRVSSDYAATMLRKLADATKRKPAVSIAPKRISPLTDEQKALVRDTHRSHPEMSQLDLAILFKTNPGRISEALNEKET